MQNEKPKNEKLKNEKLKNDSFWGAGTLPFVALWAASYPIVWVALLFVTEWIEDATDLSQSEINVVAIAFILLASGLIHVQLVERLLKHSMRGWMLYTLLGTLITFFTFRDSSITGSDQATLIMTAFSLLVPVALAQTAWLWRRVKGAWLWALASIVAAIVFVVPLRSGGSGGGDLIIPATLLYGLIQAGIMRYLWMQPRDSEKAKINQATDVEDDRYERLQEDEVSMRRDIFVDDSSQQHAKDR